MTQVLFAFYRVWNEFPLVIAGFLDWCGATSSVSRHFSVCSKYKEKKQFGKKQSNCLEVHFLMPQDSKNFWIRKLHALNMTVDCCSEWKLYIKRGLSLHDYSTYSPWKIQSTSPLGPAYEFLQLGELQICLRGKCICDQWKHKRGRKVARLHRPPEISCPVH